MTKQELANLIQKQAESLGREMSETEATEAANDKFFGSLFSPAPRSTEGEYEQIKQMAEEYLTSILGD
jgi:hypothetical protein